MQIILKQSYPSGVEFRRQAAELVSMLNVIDDDSITVDCASVSFSRSAMDELYKNAIHESSPLSAKVNFINTDEDFNEKLKAVTKTYHYKKKRLKIPKEWVFEINTTEQMLNFYLRITEQTAIDNKHNKYQTQK